jgi:DNA-binding GntR family transcriptional regulator
MKPVQTSDISGSQTQPFGVRSLAMALRTEIEKMILQGSMPMGERLNENYFAEKFQVSRGPVREAFRGLVEAGLVEFIPNRGVFVRNLSLDQAVAAYEVRAALFSQAGRLAATRRRKEEIVRFRGLVHDMDAAIERRDSDLYYKLNLELHAAVMEAARSDRLAESYQALIKELHLFRAKNLGLVDHVDNARLSNLEHAAMVEAIASGDEMRSYEAHYAHVRNARERLIASYAPG